MPKPRRSDGTVIDASFHIDVERDGPSVVFASRAGRPVVNPEYREWLITALAPLRVTDSRSSARFSICAGYESGKQRMRIAVGELAKER